MDEDGIGNGKNTDRSTSNWIWISEPLLEANEAMDAGEVPVGCVFVRDGVAIAKARNRTNELRNVIILSLHALCVDLHM